MTNSSVTIPKDLIIELHRAKCPSACPDYSIFVLEDGKVLYEGRHYVAQKGKQEGQVSRVQVRRLLDEFHRINYFSFKDRYDAIANDGAKIVTSIVANGQTKKVINCHPSKAPQELYQLEEMIDTISQSERWVRDPSGQPVLER